MPDKQYFSSIRAKKATGIALKKQKK